MLIAEHQGINDVIRKQRTLYKPQKLIAGNKKKRIVSLEQKSGERNPLRSHLHFHLNQTFISFASLINNISGAGNTFKFTHSEWPPIFQRLQHVFLFLCTSENLLSLL